MPVLFVVFITIALFFTLFGEEVRADDKPVPKGAFIVECWENECWLYERVQRIGNGGVDGLYIGPNVVIQNDRERLVRERQLIRQCAVQHGYNFLEELPFGAPVEAETPHQPVYLHPDPTVGEST